MVAFYFDLGSVLSLKDDEYQYMYFSNNPILWLNRTQTSESQKLHFMC